MSMAAVQKEPEKVMKLRGGSVLGKKTILKSDHFPGCQNKRLTPQIDGAPNYRQAESLPVHGVAIPTIEGCRNVIKQIRGRKDGKQAQVLWFNLREEPVKLFANMHPRPPLFFFLLVVLSAVLINAMDYDYCLLPFFFIN
ncbi:hypothetical protein NC651_006723 [Populus alba x Populus x berolinensis]|nr:hypothetical protein NC651_006723 [Populus alba x Populus x berolinensis]